MFGGEVGGLESEDDATSASDSASASSSDSGSGTDNGSGTNSDTDSCSSVEDWGTEGAGGGRAGSRAGLFDIIFLEEKNFVFPPASTEEEAMLHAGLIWDPGHLAQADVLDCYPMECGTRGKIARQAFPVPSTAIPICFVDNVKVPIRWVQGGIRGNGVLGIQDTW